MKATLTDGRVVTLEAEDFNPFGQVYLIPLVSRGIAPDICTMAELLGAAPAEIRYGMVHPNVPLEP